MYIYSNRTSREYCALFDDPSFLHPSVTLNEWNINKVKHAHTIAYSCLFVLLFIYYRSKMPYKNGRNLYTSCEY